MDKGCSISSLVELQQKAGGDGSGGYGSQDNTKDGGTGASGDERWCPAAGGAGPRVVAGGIGGSDDRVGGGVSDGGGGGSDGGGGIRGGGGAEQQSERSVEAGDTHPSVCRTPLRLPHASHHTPSFAARDAHWDHMPPLRLPQTDFSDSFSLFRFLLQPSSTK